jgi:hypothetical protein
LIAVALACAITAVLGCSASTADAARTAASGQPARVLAAAITTDIWQLAARPAGAAGVAAPRAVTTMFGTTDNHAASMDGLDVIVNPLDPRRSYLGVYHMSIGGGRFALRLAASNDLRNWRKIADLDATGGGMGTLRALPGGAFLLAYEAQDPTAPEGTVDSHVRLRYYRGSAALLAGAATEERTLPRRLSTTNEGTPDIRSVAWRGSLATSVVKLGFHYLDHGPRSRPFKLAVDREARGTLSGDRWSAAREATIDRGLSRMGFSGNHGARRAFTDPAGGSWRIYEAQRTVNAPGSWRLLLFDVRARTWTILRPRTPGGSRAFANPTVSVVPSPRTPGATALVVTMFLHEAGAAGGESGEAVSWMEL